MPIITPVSPNSSQNQSGPSEAGKAARERAVSAMAALMGGQPSPVNQNNVTPEELKSVKAPESGQNDTKEVSSPESQAEAPAPKEDSPKEPPLSAQYAQLARKERALRAKDQEVKAREAALKAKEEALGIKESALINPTDLKARFQKDPMQVMQEFGLTYDELTKIVLNQPDPQERQRSEELDSLKSQIQELKGLLEKQGKTYEEHQKAAEAQAVNQIKFEVSRLVNNDPNFETIKHTSSIDDVVELITRTYNEEGKIIPVEEAAQAVEDYLVEEALKITKIKKIQQKLSGAVSSPTAVGQPKAEQKPNQPQQQQMKTLTNAVSTSRKLTPRERAIAVMEGRKLA